MEGFTQLLLAGADPTVSWVLALAFLAAIVLRRTGALR